MTFDYLILKDDNSYTGENLMPDDVKGILVSSLKKDEEFVYREYAGSHRLISTGQRIVSAEFPPQSTYADLKLTLDDGSVMLLVNLYSIEPPKTFN